MFEFNYESEIVVHQVDVAKLLDLVVIFQVEFFLRLYQQIEGILILFACQQIEFFVEQPHFSAYLGRNVCVGENVEHHVSARNDPVWLVHFAVHGQFSVEDY